MKFGVRNFRGMLPIHKAMKLPDGFAMSAVDIDLKATDLRPFNQNLKVGVIASNNLIQRSGLAMGPGQIFTSDAVVNMCFGPIRYEEDKDSKIYFDSGVLGTSFPSYSTKEDAIPGSNPDAPHLGGPASVRKLGVPAAPNEPALAVETPENGQVNSIQGSTVTLSDGVTIVDDAVVLTTAAPHGMESGQRVELDGFDWAYYNNTFVIDTVVGIGLVDQRMVLRGLKYSEIEAGVDASGDPEPADPGTGTYTQGFTDQQYEDRVYLYTLVARDGEEGPPSLPSLLVTVGEGLSVTVTTSTATNVNGVSIYSKRIYRTIPTSTGAADYYFVDEIPVAQESYVDEKNHIELGEQLPSLEWIMPPEGLIGLTALPNGVMIGFKGNQLCQSEPYMPHAWPDAYKKMMDYPIVGVAAFGQHVVVATTENPYLATLSDPLTITFKKLDTVEPCVRRRSICAVGIGVLYASPNGIVMVTAGGAQNVLRTVWDQKEWKELIAAYEDIYTVYHDEKVYMTFVNNATSYVANNTEADTYIFDPAESPLQVSKLSQHKHTGAAVDRDEDKLFWLGSNSEQLGPYVYQHNPADAEGTGRLQGTWRSGYFTMAAPCNMGAAQVLFERTGFNELIVTFYADGNYVHGKQVTDMEPFRLPDGFLARDWEIQINTDSEIHGIYVAETIEELRGAGTG